MDETEACLPTEATCILRITAVYKTVSEKAALLLANTPPTECLALEGQEIYLEMKESLDVIEKRVEIKKTSTWKTSRKVAI